MGLRIAMVLPALPRTGGEARAAINLAAGWLGLGHAVEMVFLRQSGAPPHPLPPGLTTLELGAAEGEGFRPLAGYLAERRPHLLFSTTHQANMAALLARRLARRRVPLVVRAADFVSRRVSKPALREQVWRQMQQAYPRADVILAGCGAVADEVALQARIPRERIQVVPAALNLPVIARAAAQPPPHPWFTDVAEPVLLSVGALSYSKNHALALWAFALLRRRRPAKLVILGEGRMRPRLEALARRLGLRHDVALPGFLPNPFACMRHADVLVHAARWESSGNALAEALACGLPVVCVAAPGAAPEILANGRYGTLVPTREPADLAQAILAALDAPPPPEPLVRRARDFGHLRTARHVLRLVRAARPELG